MPFRALIFSLALSTCLSGTVFANQNSTSATQQFQLAQQLAMNSESSTQVRDLLEQSAVQGYLPAQKLLTEDLIHGLNGPISYSQALYWLTTIALNDPQDRGYLLARFLDSHQHKISFNDLTEAWYQVASKSNPKAESAYAHFLETRFNQLRAKQISEMAELDSHASKQAAAPKLENNELSDTSLLYPLVALGALSLALSTGWLVYRTKKTSPAKRTAQEVPQIQLLDSKVKDLQFTNQQLKRQLEKVFSEYKKAKIEAENHNLAIACAMFGYSPMAIPEPQVIKHRYRQLSKLYHPDSQGSEEEMKRLNQAFNIITQNVTR